MEELAHSKINLGLAILDKRPDGYHNIDTIFQSIRLADSIYFAKHHSVVFSGVAPELPDYMQALIPYDDRNIAVKAIKAIQDYTGTKQGAAIHLLKRTPVQAGLGGGSADAAAMLRGLNKFWGLGLSLKELETIGANLGSDVPFLVRGGTARGQGRGQVLTFQKSCEPYWLLLVKPQLSVSTAAAYGQFKGTSKVTSHTIDLVSDLITNESFTDAFNEAGNTFEELIFPLYPELVTCKDFFTSRGFPTLMTGSGPTMVVLLDKASQALALQEKIKQGGHNWFTLITKTCGEEDIHA